METQTEQEKKLILILNDYEYILINPKNYLNKCLGFEVF
jgi:hypothetical protein